MLGIGSVGAAAILAAMLVGLTNGSEASVIPYVTSRYYGLKHFTKIYGTFFSCFCLGSTFGPPMTTKLVERMGGYQGLAYAHPAAFVIGALILFAYKRFPKSQAS